MTLRTLCLLSAAMLLAPAAALSDDWPCYRGPDRTGISKETGWSAESPKVLWTATVGKGWSSVAVVGERVYTMGNDEGRDTIWCLDATTGKPVWQRGYTCDPGQDGYPGPRATPTVDGKYVFTFGRDGTLCASDAATGKALWDRRAGTRPPMWGYASSPLVVGNVVIVNAGGPGAAFNKSSGAPLWGGGGDAGYASVMATGPAGKGALLVFGAKALVGVSASGKAQWNFPWPTPMGVNAADPLVVNVTTVFVTSNYGKGCALISVKGAPRVIWQNTNMKCHYSSPVLYKDAIYGFDDATLRCLDLKTGEVKWSRDGFGKGGLSLADGKLLVLSASGDLVIAEASADAFKQISKVKALSGNCWTSPVLANGRIYCRSGEGNIACVDVRAK